MGYHDHAALSQQPGGDDLRRLQRDPAQHHRQGRARTVSSHYTLHGLDASPYSVKMRALLRYRRIPFVWQGLGSPRDVAAAAGLPPVVPVLGFPDGRLMNDSTPLAHALEREHAARSVIPDDPLLAYL